jgi:hypothetical protein
MDDRPAAWGLYARIMLAAVSLAVAAAVISISGMVVRLPDLTMLVLWLGGSLEAGKILTASWLGRR